MIFTKKNLINWPSYILGNIAIVFVFFHRFDLAVLSPYITQTFAISNTLLGAMAGMYFYAYAPLQPLVGVLVDKWKPRKVLILFSFLMSLGTFIFAYSPNIFFLFLGRFLIGLGCAGFSIPVAWMITKHFDYNKRGSLFSIIAFTENIGAVLATSPFEKLIYFYEWRNSLGIIASTTLFLTLLFHLFVRNNNGIKKETNRNIKMKDNWFIILRTTLKIPIIKYCSITFLSSASIVSLQGLWAVPFLMDVYNIEKNTASNFVTLIPIGIMTGTIIFAKINDTKYNKYVFFVAMFLSAVVYLTFVVFTNKLNDNIMTVMFFLIGFLQGPFIPFMIKIFSSFLPRKTFGASLGIVNAIPLILSALFQHFTGFLFDSLKDNRLLLYSNIMSYKVYFCFLFFSLVIVIWASTHIIKIINLVEIKQL